MPDDSALTLTFGPSRSALLPSSSTLTSLTSPKE
jgi:hypothetical protein